MKTFSVLFGVWLTRMWTAVSTLTVHKLHLHIRGKGGWERPEAEVKGTKTPRRYFQIPRF